MKIRIKGNSVRLRLTKSEVDQIASTGKVIEETQFIDNQLFYSITKADHSSISFRDGNIEVQIEDAQANEWSSSNEVGIQFTSGAVQVLIEKDFACLITRDGEDDADTFPNPLAAHAD